MTQGTSVEVAGSSLDLDFGIPEERPGERTPPPNEGPTPEGLAEYLAVHPDIVGIGPAKAKVLTETFGRDFSGALRRQKDVMAKVAGVSLEAIERLATLWLDASAERRQTQMWLASLGLTYTQIATIEGKYRAGARAVLEKNPYLLAREVKGFGFAKADAVAKLAGVELASEPRIEACAEYVVRQCHEDGHTWIGFGEAAGKIGKLLELGGGDSGRERIEGTVNRLVYEGRLTGTWITSETWALSTPSVFRREREAGYVLKVLGGRTNPWRREFLQAGAGPTEGGLTEAQRAALTQAMNQQVCVVTGGAGTGKTHTMATIARRYQRAGKKLALAAPTGKAAKRMGEMQLEDVTPQTLHRLLGYDGKSFGKRRGKSAKSAESAAGGEGEGEATATAVEAIDADVLLIDEASMVDVVLLCELLRAVDARRTAIVFFGDPYQLPSVGAGSVLRDMIERKIVPTVKLEVVMRQAGVLKAASMGVLEGKIAGSTKEEVQRKGSHCGSDPSPSGGCCSGTDDACNCECSTCRDPNTGALHSKEKDVRWPWVVLRKKGDLSIGETVEKLFAEELPGKLGVAWEDIQVLSPSYKGEAGVEALNLRLQRVVQGKRGVTIGESGGRPRPRVGDRVIQSRNNYELGDGGVMNGTVGVLAGEERNERGLPIGYRVMIDGEAIRYDLGQVKQLDLAYALTVHRSQGSEFPVVIVVVSRAHSFMLHRNLLYTAVTRAQKMVVLVGDEQGMLNAVKRTLLEKRRTFLGALKEREEYRPRWFEAEGRGASQERSV